MNLNHKIHQQTPALENKSDNFDNISNLIDKFLFHLEYSKNVSPRTLENYSLRLNRLVNYVGDIQISKLKSMHVLDYRIYLNSLGLDKKTVNYHVVVIRSFLKFLLRNDIDCLNPEKLELAKIPPREVNYLTEEEVERLLQAPKDFCNGNEVKTARDEAILNFLFGTGLRVSELISLEKKNIKSDSNQFSVVGKGSKLRSVFITKKALEKLNDYLKLRNDDSPVLFVNLSSNYYGKSLSRNAIEEIVRNYAKLVGINKKVSPHTLRHSYATTLIKKGADIRAVQTLLGHASITTTQIYTHVDDKHLQKVHKLLDD